jgi:hypothetical protein
MSIFDVIARDKVQRKYKKKGEEGWERETAELGAVGPPAETVRNGHDRRCACASSSLCTPPALRPRPRLQYVAIADTRAPRQPVFRASSHRTCVGWTCEIEAPCDVQHCDGAKSARLIQNRVRADDCRARDTSHAATSVAVRPQVPACHRAGTESRKLVFSELYRVTQLHEPLHARAASRTHRVGSR